MFVLLRRCNIRKEFLELRLEERIDELEKAKVDSEVAVCVADFKNALEQDCEEVVEQCVSSRRIHHVRIGRDS